MYNFASTLFYELYNWPVISFLFQKWIFDPSIGHHFLPQSRKYWNNKCVGGTIARCCWSLAQQTHSSGHGWAGTEDRIWPIPLLETLHLCSDYYPRPITLKWKFWPSVKIFVNFDGTLFHKNGKNAKLGFWNII